MSVCVCVCVCVRSGKELVYLTLSFSPLFGCLATAAAEEADACDGGNVGN